MKSSNTSYFPVQNLVNPIGSRGIKIVENKLNKRISDIFFTKKEDTIQRPDIGQINKRKLIETAERRIGENLRSVSPTINGRKNENFTPLNLNSTISFCESGNIYPRNLKLSMNKSIIKDTTPPPQFNLQRSSSMGFLSQDRSLLSQTQLHVKSQSYLESKKQEKLKRQEQLIRSASQSLISSLVREKEYLCDEFSNSFNGLFTPCRRVEHTKQRTLKKFFLMQELQTSKQVKKQIKEQRIGISDYHEMNEKIIDRSMEIHLACNNSASYFNDIKKLNYRNSVDLKLTEQIYRPKENTKKVSVIKVIKPAADLTNKLSLNPVLNKSKMNSSLSTRRDTPNMSFSKTPEKIKGGIKGSTQRNIPRFFISGKKL